MTTTGKLDARALKDFWVDETPTGTINGSNTSFTISSASHESEAFNLYLDGLKLTNSTDYSLSSTTITMVTAPAVGQSLRANYVKLTGE